jgi:hypothetical protein
MKRKAVHARPVTRSRAVGGEDAQGGKKRWRNQGSADRAEHLRKMAAGKEWKAMINRLSSFQYSVLRSFFEGGLNFYVTISELHRFDQRAVRSRMILEWIAYRPGRGFLMAKTLGTSGRPTNFDGNQGSIVSLVCRGVCA